MRRWRDLKVSILFVFFLVLALAFVHVGLKAEAAYNVKKVYLSFMGTAGEALTTGQAVCLKDADGYVYKADANDSDLRPAVGVVGSKTASASGQSVEVIVVGVLNGWSSLAENGTSYLSETAGALTQSAPSYAQIMGFAINTTSYLVNCRSYFDTSAITSLGVLSGASPIILEGATADAYETTFAVTDPTADRTVTLPDSDVNLGSIANALLAAGNAYFTVALTHDGQETATVDPVHTFQMPFAATLVEVSATARDLATDGNQTYTVDLEEAGTTVLSSAISLTADNTPVVGTVSDSSIADNAKMEVVLTLGGNSPAADDTTVLIVFKRAHVN